MNTEIIEKTLSCPQCGAEMAVTSDCKSVYCLGAKRHLWDVSSSGYVNFSGSGGGDPKEAVRARQGFLSLGHYKPLAELCSAMLQKYVPANGAVADAGCGEGYYDSFFTAAGYRLCGFDLSRTAVDAAAKRHIENAFYAVAGINAMPVRGGVLSAVTNIFAPCFEGEFTRVLKPGGVLIVAAAGERHLLSLKRALYDSATLNTQRADLPAEMRAAETRRLSYDFTLDSRQSISDLFSMTPYYYRTSRKSVERLESVGCLTVEADFEVSVFIKE